ncbi:MAG: bifunctional MaoC family dehydratase/OB-fold nucleic acid binding domain-containing protein [Proteobacteria bacterium]|nr:bifunctional MaoC family dehydratase/OB-fold nucleic acid binding domain-containing protein [Pseudomonadota bacterium]HQR05165.1 bifunctional MaoC family dehydratase N-terminal/OB-fold nucleic acid binding domain-containing protein [Rhodocyclaceae bacterium]
MSEPNAQVDAAIKGMVGTEYGRTYSWDPVNQPMIRQWCETMDNESPLYHDPEFARQSPHGGPVAPPTMLQVWVMAGLKNRLPPGSTTRSPFEAVEYLRANGFPSTVAVNSEQEYFRYLRPDESISFTAMLESVSDCKSTALGTGYFVTVLMTFLTATDEKVGTMRFRLFVYKAHKEFKPAAAAPADAPAKPSRPHPGISQDTQFFWDGLKQNKLLIQKCKGCGKLRHPPGPVCPHCHSFEWEALQASGRGTVHSFVVMHYPEVPGFPPENPVLLVELEEGTRLVAGLVGIKHADVKVGMPVRVEYQKVDDDLVVPVFRPV